MLRIELAFYLGCLNLHERARGERASRPASRSRVPPGGRGSDRAGLYDVCLALHLDGRAVGNDVAADGKGARR